MAKPSCLVAGPFFHPWAETGLRGDSVQSCGQDKRLWIGSAGFHFQIWSVSLDALTQVCQPLSPKLHSPFHQGALERDTTAYSNELLMSVRVFLSIAKRSRNTGQAKSCLLNPAHFHLWPNKALHPGLLKWAAVSHAPHDPHCAPTLPWPQQRPFAFLLLLQCCELMIDHGPSPWISRLLSASVTNLTLSNCKFSHLIAIYTCSMSLCVRKSIILHLKSPHLNSTASCTDLTIKLIYVA